MVPFKKRSHRVVTVTLLVFFFVGIIFGTISKHRTDHNFQEYTQNYALRRLSENTLNLHYTLANPKNYQLHDYEPTFGSISTDEDAYFSTLENERKILSSFSYDNLSNKNQLSYDILDLYYHTELADENHFFLSELLSPSLGIQAQLPLLLAEYTFRTPKDVEDYFYLLKDVPSYFDSIIAFEKEKSKRGFFMSDTTAERIIKQCQSFLSSKDNYLQSVFEERMTQLNWLTKEEQSDCIALHERLINQCVIPAYQSLIFALEKLKGTGQNPYGLFYWEGGKEYYTYLIKSNCGIYDSIEELQTQLASQLAADYKELQTLTTKNSSLTTTIHNMSPEQILISLREKMQVAFPDIDSVSYEIKYIHDDLKDHLSPAFYLTPPLDIKSPNLIYLNPASNLHGIELYTTLAHEGFPGHLYQTQYFMNHNSDFIRYLFSMAGYVEGWATYIESFAYEYGSPSQELGRILWLSRSMNLCIYSLLDIGIHYYGWTPEKANLFLNKLGITDSTVCQEIFQCIVEDPVNYLKYYGGCLQFLKLRKTAAATKDFHLIDFHQKVLEIGPCQFPILEKYLTR